MDKANKYDVSIGDGHGCDVNGCLWKVAAHNAAAIDFINLSYTLACYEPRHRMSALPAA